MAVRSNLPCLEIEQVSSSSRNEIKTISCIPKTFTVNTREQQGQSVLHGWLGQGSHQQEPGGARLRVVFLVWVDRAVGMGTDPRQGWDISIAGGSSLEKP